MRKLLKLNLYSKYIDNVKFDKNSDDETTSRLFSHTEIASCSPKHLSLSDDSREVAVYIVGYIAKKLKND